ncbi:MAG TPA: RNA polymerase sigma factor RpoD/SigA [bacterium]|nr:RNA polymerase sigma factor RpoD/SigA [bacterium]HOL47974.1 RNA polymerase sigma factor RpoD/SigA [bacterium]HPQ18038.1 RNA polymerase sigma factor RpoD/SigA [bacterium]
MKKKKTYKLKEILEWCYSKNNEININELIDNFNIEETNINSIISFLQKKKIKIKDEISEEDTLFQIEELKDSIDSLYLYLEEISKIKLLTPKEEKEYGKKIYDFFKFEKIIMQKYKIKNELLLQIKKHGIKFFDNIDFKKEIKNAKKNINKKINIKKVLKIYFKKFQEYQLAKRKLIESNLKLVINIAKQYQNKGLSLLDLINEGNLGLITGVDKYNYKLGFRFSTYISWWIKQSIRKAIANQSRIIRLPFHLSELINSWIKSSKEYYRLYDKEPTIEELAKYMGLPINKLMKIMQLSQQPTSLDSIITENQSNMYNIIEDENANKEFEKILADEKTNEIKTIIETNLTDKEKIILNMLYGLNGEKPKSLAEIGRELNITRERVRQIKNKIMNKIKKIYKEIIKEKF